MTAKLQTGRLLLRPPAMDDADAIAAALNDFGVAGNLARVPFPYKLADARAWLRSRRPHLPPSETNFTIELPGEGCVGAVGFHQGVNGTILGYWLARPQWGMGLMTEAATAAVEWFFAESASMLVHSGAFHFNAASLAVQHKLGFVETGRSTLLCLARGREVEHIDTELTRERFRQK